MNSASPSLPVSAVSQTIKVSGLFGFAVAMTVIIWKHVEAIDATFLLLFSTALPMIIVSWWQQRQQGTSSSPAPVNYPRLKTKMIGLVTIFGAIAFFYWVIPEYHKNNYTLYLVSAIFSFPILLFFAQNYFEKVENSMKDPEDGYWHLGSKILRKNIVIDEESVRQLFLGWLVKVIFLPIMVVGLYHNIQLINQYHYDDIIVSGHFLQFYSVMLLGIFTLDLTFGVIGYICTFRLLNTHIRSTDGSFFGWWVALICYAPFSSLLNSYLFISPPHQDRWIAWFQHNMFLTTLWGSIILIIFACYAYSTVCFGLTFSNLTYRGIITSGFYRYTKHPAYILKNLGMWCMYVPFLSGENEWQILQACFLLGGVNIIYYYRAKTEEQHLERYPEYQHYVHWIHTHGWIARLRGKLGVHK